MFSSFLHCSLSALFAPPFCLSVTENVHRAQFRRGAILLWAVLLYAAQTRVLNVLLLPRKKAKSREKMLQRDDGRVGCP
jgi:hypothetical protein